MHALEPMLANGIGDALISLCLLLGWLSVYTIGGLTLLAFITKRRAFCAVSFVLCIPFAILLVPWSAPTLVFDDPDFGYQYLKLRSLAYASYAVIAFAILGFVAYMRHKVSQPGTQPELSAPKHSQVDSSNPYGPPN